MLFLGLLPHQRQAQGRPCENRCSVVSSHLEALAYGVTFSSFGKTSEATPARGLTDGINQFYRHFDPDKGHQGLKRQIELANSICQSLG